MTLFSSKELPSMFANGTRFYLQFSKQFLHRKSYMPAFASAFVCEWL